MQPIIDIPARARIGRAMDLPKESYKEQYNEIEAEIRQQIAQISAGGERA